MNAFKFLVVFTLLLFGSFAHRFQRHVINGTQNGLINGNTEMNNLDALSSDEKIYEQYGNYIKFVRDGEEVDLELEYKTLSFKFCSDGCMKKTVRACYDSSNPNIEAKGECSPGQCEFKAGISEDAGKQFLWFKKEFYNNGIGADGMCRTAIMEHPEATPDGFLPFPSCEPLKHDGNVVKLYVNHVEPGCPFYVENAKIWIPPPPTTKSQSSSDLLETNQTTSNSSEANTTLWIVIGVGIFILLILFIGFGYFCYRTQIQNKPLFGKEKDVQQKANILEASNKAKSAENEKSANEKLVLEPEKVVAKPESTKEATKEDTNVAKEKHPKPAKKKAPKEKKAPINPNPSKEITQENETKEDAPPAKKVSAEPTLENPTTEKSFVQQRQPGNPTRASVSKKVILPAMNSDGFKSVSLFDTLSGAENDKTQHSTHGSEKPRKNESAGRKKGSKKRR